MHQEKLRDLFIEERNARLFRDKVNEALGFIVNACTMVQAYIRQQQAEFEEYQLRFCPIFGTLKKENEHE